MGKFVIKNTKTGVKFDLLAGNGEVIATSEVYSSLNACRGGIDSVKIIAANANLDDQTDANDAKVVNPKFEVYKDKAGEFRFRLKARNGKVVVASEGYTSKAGCLNGIDSVRRNAPDAQTEIKE